MRDGLNARRRAFLSTAALLGGAALLESLHAAPWPERLIKVIVAGSAGASLDLIGRTYAEALAEQLSQTVIVENRPGAGMRVGAEVVARSPADGYTILVAAATPLNQAPVVFKNPGFDPLKDFRYIGAIDNGPLVVVVRQDLPVKTTRELLDYSRKNPVSFGTWGQGSYAHLFAGEMNRLFGAQINAVHYNNASKLMSDVAGGHLDACVNVYGVLLPYIEAGRMRAVSIAKGPRLARLPGIPTMREEGFDQSFFKLGGYFVFAVPSGTPPEVVTRLSDAMQKASQSTRVQQLHEKLSIDPKVLDAGEAQAMMQTEAAEWAGVTKSLGVSLD